MAYYSKRYVTQNSDDVQLSYNELHDMIGREADLRFG